MKNWLLTYTCWDMFHLPNQIPICTQQSTKWDRNSSGMWWQVQHDRSDSSLTAVKLERYYNTSNIKHMSVCGKQKEGCFLRWWVQILCLQGLEDIWLVRNFSHTLPELRCILDLLFWELLPLWRLSPLPALFRRPELCLLFLGSLILMIWPVPLYTLADYHWRPKIVVIHIKCWQAPEQPTQV